LDSRHDQVNTEIILRLHHIFEKHEHPLLSKNVTVDLDTLFNKTYMKINNPIEKTLSLWLDKDKLHRQQWIPENQQEPNSKATTLAKNNELVIGPIEIRTFSALTQDKLPGSNNHHIDIN